MVLYRPREEQRYYYGADQTEVYWVHFTGNNVKNFLRRYGIADDTRIIYTGISIEYKNLFMSMIEDAVGGNGFEKTDSKMITAGKNCPSAGFLSI